MSTAGTTNTLLFQSMYSCPQHTAGKQVLELQYSFNYLLTAFLETRRKK